MNKRTLIVLLVVLIGGAAVYGLTMNKNDNTKSGAAKNSSSQSTQPAKPAATSASEVAIENFAFSPGDITVKKGTSVTWTNKDSSPHTVTETDNQTGPKSENLKQGDKYSFTFSSEGTYHYRCDIHPDMLGTVTVTQ